MSLGRFHYHQPSTLEEACRLGAKYGPKGAFLGGGTELLVDLRSGRKQKCHVIALERLEGLSGIAVRDDILHIGALTSLSDIAESPHVQGFVPALCDAIGTMAGRQIRNRGTIGGNFCCGVPCSDTPTISCAAGAKIAIVGPEGSERTVGAHEFVLAPRVTVLRPGEIVTAVLFPRQPAGSGASFQRFSLRRGSALAVASVSAWVRLDGDTIAEARIFMGAVGPVPLSAPKAAASLLNKTPSGELFTVAAQLAATEAQPISDLRGSAQYRRDVVEVLTRRALAEACGRAKGGE